MIAIAVITTTSATPRRPSAEPRGAGELARRRRTGRAAVAARRNRKLGGADVAVAPRGGRAGIVSRWCAGVIHRRYIAKLSAYVIGSVTRVPMT